MKRIIKNLSIIALILVAFVAIWIISSNNFDKKARLCDEMYGYKCSYYQVKNFRN